MNIEKKIFSKLTSAINNFNLIEDGDRVLVALSGGKDSLALVEMLGRRMQIFKPRFTAEAIHVRMSNVAYESSTSYLEDFCDKWHIPLTVVTTSFDQETDHRSSPCFLCSWQRRKEMFRLAQEHQCNKIALGHHQDDLIYTALMNLTFHGQFSTMKVRQVMDKMPLTIIRPLCLVQEAELVQLAEAHHYEKQAKLCPYEKDTKRAAVANLFGSIEAMSPEARYHIWHALQEAGALV